MIYNYNIISDFLIFVAQFIYYLLSNDISLALLPVCWKSTASNDVAFRMVCHYHSLDSRRSLADSSQVMYTDWQTATLYFSGSIVIQPTYICHTSISLQIQESYIWLFKYATTCQHIGSRVWHVLPSDTWVPGKLLVSIYIPMWSHIAGIWQRHLFVFFIIIP